MSIPPVAGDAAARRYFDIFAANGPFTMFVKDMPCGTYLFVNKLFDDMFKTTPGGVVGKTDRDILPPELAFEIMAEDRAVVETGLKHERVVAVPHFDGQTRSWFAVRFPMRDETGKAVVGGFGVDITARIVAEEERIAAQKMLQQTYKFLALGEMAGNIAHEINNPLAIIAGKTRQLMDVVQRVPVDLNAVARFAQAIADTTQRMIKIVGGLRTLSRRTETDPPKSKSVAALLEETLALCVPRFHQAEIRLDVAPVDAALTLECRAVDVSQILLNLIGNAYDAVLATEDPWVLIDVAAEQDAVVFTVTDSGPAISAEVASKLMQPFFTTKPEGTGTGLGLSISQRLAVAHGGSLVYDAQGGHTRFVLRLPRRTMLMREA